MRKVKKIIFSLLCVLLVCVFNTGVFAAVYLSINIRGEIYYTPQGIQAKIWGTHAINTNGNSGTHSYLSFSGAGTSEDNVYTVTTEEKSYSSINANIGTVNFQTVEDTMEIYVFIKNSAKLKYILPNIEIEQTSNQITILKTEYYFDVSSVADPLTTKNNSASANTFISSIDNQISGGNVASWQSNMSIDNSDVWLARVVIGIKSGTTVDGSLQINGLFNIEVGILSDIQYDSNDILSVKQLQSDSENGLEWSKIGYNYTLKAEATKVENNSLAVLHANLSNSSTDEYKNADITRGQDDYSSAVVYKDIDLVNIDIKTGEVIGKLSDVNYPFEWYGRSVTLPANTTLPSGRKLTQETTFDRVDVYTYYPTMYIRRWMISDWQYISLSDKEFDGSVKIDEFYTATFETTIFNYNKTIATVNNNIVPRSYVNDFAPLSGSLVSHLQNNYGFKTTDQDGVSVTVPQATTQEQYLIWCKSLTDTWANSGLASQYRQNKGIQGENWRKYVYNILYTVKYANNNSQETVGYGNVSSQGLYDNKELVNYSGATYSAVRYLDAAKGGGTIGVYGTEGTNSNSYTQNAMGEYVLKPTVYNTAGMNYGYNYTGYTYVDSNNLVHKEGLYANQFLTYNTGTDRYLLDGYVGSNQYTSVFCLGICNPWGNTWNWVFGTAVIWNNYDSNADGTDDSWLGYTYINFEDYDGTNWFTQTTSGFENKKTALENNGYIPLSFNLPQTTNYYKYLGVSSVDNNLYAQLIGIQTSTSGVASDSSGLTDYNYVHRSEGLLFGIWYGGSVTRGSSAGIFCFHVDHDITGYAADIGFRSALIPI